MADLEIPIYIGCDNTFELDGLRNARTPTSYVNSGSGSFVLYDPDGVAVTNASSLTMTYATSSDGDWYVTIPASATVLLTENYKYNGKCTMTDGTYTVIIWTKFRAEKYYGE